MGVLGHLLDLPQLGGLALERLGGDAVDDLVQLAAQVGEPGQQPFAVQCTSIANLDRVAQNRKFEAIAEKGARQAALDAAEKDGSRVKPEFGSVWLTMNGQDRASARIHTTIAVPNATTQSLGLPDNPSQGGVWIMNAGTPTAHLMTPGS